MQHRFHRIACALLAGSALAWPAPAAALTLFEAANLHMMMESMSLSLEVASRNAAALTGRSTPLPEAAGTTLFSFTGHYDDAGWNFSGAGRYGGEDFTLAETGTLTGAYGSDLQLVMHGSGDMAGYGMVFRTNASWGWDPALQAYSVMQVDSAAKTETIVGKIITWFVRTAETLITYTAEVLVEAAVNGAVPGAGTIVGAAAGDATYRIISKVTTSISDVVLKRDDDEFTDWTPEDQYEYEQDKLKSSLISTPNALQTVVNPQFLDELPPHDSFNLPWQRQLGIVNPDGNLFSGSVTSAGGVPEPASWALMIAGFGMVGLQLRRRREAVSR